MRGLTLSRTAARVLGEHLCTLADSGEEADIEMRGEDLLVNGLYLHPDGEWATYPPSNPGSPRRVGRSLDSVPAGGTGRIDLGDSLLGTGRGRHLRSITMCTCPASLQALEVHAIGCPEYRHG